MFSKLKTKFLTVKDGYKLYMLKEDLTLKLDNETIKVPKEFVTDLASVPKALSKWIKRDNHKYIKSAIVHDYLYDIGYKRSEADNIFKKAILIESQSCKYALSFWLGVRLFGWIRYNK